MNVFDSFNAFVLLALDPWLNQILISFFADTLRMIDHIIRNIFSFWFANS